MEKSICILAVFYERLSVVKLLVALYTVYLVMHRFQYWLPILLSNRKTGHLKLKETTAF